MAITLETATSTTLEEVVEVMATWQHEGGPVQLHPGDLGWNWRVGAEALAREVRAWRREETVVAAGMVDDSGLIRLGVAPAVNADDEFAAQLLADLEPGHGVLAAGVNIVEARYGDALHRAFRRAGWTDDEPWTPLVRDLSEPVDPDPITSSGMHVEVVDEQTALDRVAVQRAAFANSTFTLEAWRNVVSSPAYRRARCLLGRSPSGDPVAATTVWSAGPGRPGLIEPLGAHPDHRGHGYGRAITVAAAVALQEMGASSVTVCTPAANTVGVAAYVSAGFTQLEDVRDFSRPA